MFVIKAHVFNSDSSIFPSAQIIVPKYAVTYFFSSFVIFEIMIHASAGVRFVASLPMIFCFFTTYSETHKFNSH